MEPGRPPIGLRDRLVGGDRGQALLRPFRQAVGIEAVVLARVQGPEQKQELRGRRLEQHREIEVEGAEADAVFAQLAAIGLVEGLDLGRRRVAAEDAEILGQAEGEAAGEARQILCLAERHQRLEPRVEMGGKPGFEAFHHALAVGRR